MIPSLPDGSSTYLSESIRPQQWENLGGGFSWFKVIGETVEDHDEFGKIVRVQPYGPIGAIAKHISERQVCPWPSILQAGTAGIGKSGFAELLARTHLAKKRLPVTYTTNSGDVITLVDQDGHPFRLNPDGHGPDKYVRRAFAEPGNEVNPSVQFYSAAPMRKPDIDELGAKLRHRMMPGERRVVYIAEIDGIRKDQMGSLRVALDKKDFPKGLLVLADTNHLDTVRRNFGRATMERFHVLAIPNWKPDQLRPVVTSYIEAFGIQFDYESFESKSQPVETIVRKAEGGIRKVIDTFQGLKDLSGTIDKATLAEIISSAEVRNDEMGATAWRFFQNVVHRANTTPQDVVRYTNTLYQEQANLAQFVNSLGTYLLQRHPKALAQPAAGEAMRALMDLISYQGEPVYGALWASTVAPLNTIALAVKNENR